MLPVLCLAAYSPCCAPQCLPMRVLRLSAAPFKLADGLFYAAALENAASAMEVAAIEGRMTAALAVKHLRAAAAAQQAGQGPQLVQAGAERAAEAGAAAAA